MTKAIKKPKPKPKAKPTKPKKPLSVAEILKRREEEANRQAGTSVKSDNKPNTTNSQNLPTLPERNSDLRTLRYANEYLEFIDWQAMPKEIREPETMGALAKKLGITIDTLVDWKKRTGFYEDVRDARRRYIKDEMLGTALLCLKKKILKEGGASEVKLLFQLADEFEEKSVVENRKPSRLTEEQKAGFAERLRRWKTDNLTTK